MNRTKLIIFLCLLWLCPFIITSFFNQPAIDDYWNAGAINQYGRWGAVSYFYQSVSARYVSLFIMSACNTLPQHEVWIVKVWPIVTLLLLFASVYFLYSSLFDENQPKLTITALALLFIVLHIACMRSLFEGLYWMSSAVCYQLAIAVFAIAVGAILSDIKSPRVSMKAVAIAASCLLPGTVELVVPVYMLVLLCLLFVSARQQRGNTLILCCLVISLVFSFFLLKSGGNLSRIESNKTFYHQMWLQAAYLSLQSCGYYLIVWVINPLVISAILLLTESPLRIAKPFRMVMATRGYLALLAVTAVSGFALYYPLHLFESSLPFPRITTLFFFFFFQAWVVLQAFLFWQIPVTTFLKTRARTGNYIRTAIAGLFFLFAFTNRNFLWISRDLLNGSAGQYNTESTARYHLIRTCPNDTCYVPPYSVWPYFAQSAAREPSEPGSFQHMNEYFKKTILLRKP